MKAIVSKTFVQAIETFHQDIRRFKRFLTDKRISYNEKKILNAWLLLRDNKLGEAKETLDKISGNEDKLILGHYLLLYGIINNNESEFRQASAKILAAISILEEYPTLHRSLFIALENLFIVFSNLKDLGQMQDIIKKVTEIGARNELEKISIVRMEFSYHLMKNDLTKASTYLLKLEDLKSQMSAPQVTSYLIEKFDYYIKGKHYEQCYLVLDEFKQFRKFYLSANYHFMQSLLDHLTKNTAIYLYQQDFQEFPFLLHQVMVLKNLEAGDEANALVSWNELKEVDSKTYGENFSYTGDVTLFSQCLAKNLAAIASVNPGSEMDAEDSKEDIFFHYLTQTGTINKSTLYKILWREEAANKDDFLKLNSLAARVRKKYQVDIRSKKGFFVIEKEVAKKTA